MPPDLGRVAVEPVTITDDGETVIVRCNGCLAEQRFPYSPTAELLSGIERFVNGHADCC